MTFSCFALTNMDLSGVDRGKLTLSKDTRVVIPPVISDCCECHGQDFLSAINGRAFPDPFFRSELPFEDATFRLALIKDLDPTAAIYITPDGDGQMPFDKALFRIAIKAMTALESLKKTA